MTYTLPQYHTDCMLNTRLTRTHLTVILTHEGTVLDRLDYAKTGGTVRVPGEYPQTELGAC